MSSKKSRGATFVAAEGELVFEYRLFWFILQTVSAQAHVVRMGEHLRITSSFGICIRVVMVDWLIGPSNDNHARFWASVNEYLHFTTQ